ncbi:MAG: enoyl-CoA hydratase-related protein [Sandaracinaceae bacterium]|nr:enoyl-CoA hydratase-related protein [Sandaracinaceae bacterium]
MPAEQLRAEAHALARELATGPAFAHAMTKRMLEYEAHVDFATGIEAEAQAQAICMQHPDFREAYDAWAEKRPPRFA